MIEEKYIESLKTRIAKYIKMAQTRYEELLAKSKNITSFYDFNIETDELGDLIEDILYTKKQLARLVNALSYQDSELRNLTPAEEAELNHQRLLGDKKIIEEQMHIIKTAISEISREVLMHRLSNRLELERFKLGAQLGKINSELRIYDHEPDLTDGEIDIYIKQQEEGLPFQGTIYLHDTAIEVGVIDYRGPVDNKWLGDIGYTIRREHQGHNYAYKALELISQLIASKGIEKITITTYPHNIPSVRTIEKFGGILNEDLKEDFLSYTCYIKPMLEKNAKTQ